MKRLQYIFLSIVLLALLLGTGMVSGAQAEQLPACTFTLDKTSMLPGESLTASWEITGGSPPYHVVCAWYHRDNKTGWTKYPVEETNGSAQFVPQTAGKVYIRVDIQDSEGATGSFYSDYVTVYHVEEGPPQCVLALDKPEGVVAGQAITASWEITGVTGDYNVSGVWRITDARGQSRSTKAVISENTSTHTVLTGEQGIFELTVVTWSAGQTIRTPFQSEPFTITGSPAPVTGTVQFDKPGVMPGETITATWKLQGGVPPYDITCMWLTVDAQENNNRFPPEKVKDSASFVPDELGSLYCFLSVTDATSFTYQIRSERVIIGSLEPLTCEVLVTPMETQTGEALTATWKLEGGNPPFKATCTWHTYDDENSQEHPEDETDGTAHFVPTAGGWAYLRIEVEDARGKLHYFSSNHALVWAPQEQAVQYTQEMIDAKVNELAAACIAAASTEYDKAKWMFDWLVNNATYDYTGTYYGPEGVLLAGKGICASFASAYQRLMSKVGISNRYVSGQADNGTGGWGGHAWNLVKIGGSWYHADPTWGSRYFLKSDQTMSTNHRWDVASFPAASHDWGKAPVAKGTYDLSETYWEYSAPLLFDGTEKNVTLIGLPAGLKAVYTGNTATQAGTYTASVTFEYDAVNFEKPEMPDLSWEIRKKEYDLSGTKWIYYEPFDADGNEKTVTLSGLPEGLTPIYSGNTATLPGNYTASVTFDIDETYCIMPVVPDLEWVINKSTHYLDLMYRTGWDYWYPFTYDSTEKTVVLKNLPEGLTPIYNGNTATQAGTYTASVTFDIEETYYEVPVIPDLEWVINKSTHYLDLIYWTDWDYWYPFTYDGTEKTVALKNLPEGITPIYTGNTATQAGTYTASVTFDYDATNYEEPVMPDLEWAIEEPFDWSDQNPFDPSDFWQMGWDYQAPFIYDGTEKTVTITGLPEGLTPVYTGNTAILPGNYTASVVFDPEETPGYIITFSDLQWTIIGTAPDGDTNDPSTGGVLPGDANADNAVDILDLVSIIDHIVSGTPCTSMINADANGDGNVDILDLVWIIDKIVRS